MFGLLYLPFGSLPRCCIGCIPLCWLWLVWLPIFAMHRPLRKEWCPLPPGFSLERETVGFVGSSTTQMNFPLLRHSGKPFVEINKLKLFHFFYIFLSLVHRVQPSSCPTHPHSRHSNISTNTFFVSTNCNRAFHARDQSPMPRDLGR